MKNLYKYIFVLAGITILIFVVIYWQFILIAIVAINENPEKDTALISQAIETEDFKKCKKVPAGYVMSDANPRGDCYRALVEKTGNIQICESKEVTQDYDWDHDTCYAVVAAVTKNPALCSTLPSNKNGFMLADQCYFGVAKAVGDFTICDLIPDQDGREKGQCYGYFVQKKEDLQICNSLKDPLALEVCQGSFEVTGNVNI